jgi:two-component system, sporulation sensor kinase E
MHLLPKVKAVTVIGLVSGATGVYVMTGWALHLLPFFSAKMDYALVMFNTALAFCLLGAALLITQFQIKKYNTIVFRGLSFLVFVIGALSVSQDIFHFEAGFDQLFIIDQVAIVHKYTFPGRMSDMTAVCFVLFGLAFFGISTKSRLIHTISQYLLNAVTAIAFMSIVVYLYGLSLFFNLYYTFSMAVPTAILFFFISIIASLLYPALGLTGLFTGKLIGNSVIRRLSILVAFRIIIFGAIDIQSNYFQFFSVRISVSLLAFCFLIVGIGVILHTAHWLNKIDLKRCEAEEEIKVMNEQLEKTVENRTTQLLASVKDLKKSEGNYRSLIEQASDAIYVHNFEGTFTDVNASMCKMTGYNRVELMQMRIIDLLEPDQLQTDPLLLGALGIGKSIIKQRQLIHKNGQLFDVEVNLKTIADNQMLVIARDITERKKADDVLKRSEANLKIIMDTTDIAYVLLDRQLNVMAFNQMAVKFITDQFNHIPVKGDLLADYIPKNRYTQFMIYSEAVLKGSNISYEMNFPKADGSVHWYNARLFPITNDENEIFGLMMALSDITATKNSEESLKNANVLIQSHVNSMKETAWKQSHLIRGPLATLKGSMDMLQTDPANDKIVNYIKGVLERLDDVIVELAEEVSDQ